MTRHYHTTEKSLNSQDFYTHACIGMNVQDNLVIIFTASKYTHHIRSLLANCVRRINARAILVNVIRFCFTDCADSVSFTPSWGIVYGHQMTSNNTFFTFNEMGLLR